MNEDLAIDWNQWQTDEPGVGFADRIMHALETPAPFVRRASSVRKVALLAAATMAVGSAAALAAVGLRMASRSDVPREDGNRLPMHQVPSAPSSVASPRARVDRELRDEVRAKFERGLEASGVERDPHTGLTIPSGAHAASSRLPREYIQARIRRDFYPLALGCYEAALTRSPNLRGRIVVDFMIVGDAKVGGIVDQAEIDRQSDIEDAEFRTCLRESMLSMVFEAPENDGWMTVTYPFVFAPDDDGQRDR